MLDTLIRGGTVVDGTGSEPRMADVGIRDGIFVAVGEVDERAKQTIDATGLAVCPGFVDIHTHYDAQVMWDGTLSPSALHGVTTVIGGNCGFTLAPIVGSPEYLMHMLARVEGMPIEALEAGLDWEWRSFGEWLGRLDGRVSINAGFLVGHNALRWSVMGERAVGNEANEVEIAEMADLLRESLHSGGLGFSTTRGSPHVDHRGDPVPSRWATADELVQLAGVAGEFPGTSLEMVPTVERPFAPDVVDLMVSMAVAADRAMNWNLFTVVASDGDDLREGCLLPSDIARAAGSRIVGLTLPDVMRLRLSLAGGVLYDTLPEWGPVMRMGLKEKMVALSDPGIRTMLRAGASKATFNRRWADWTATTVTDVGNTEHASLVGRSIGAIAEESRTDPFDTFLDLAISDNLATGFQPPAAGDDDASWKMRSEYWRDNRIVIGGSDAGAHLDQVATYNCYSNFVGPVVRDRQLISLAEAVRLATDVPARLIGLDRRGRISEGWHSDLVIFDPATVGPAAVEGRYDLPAGAFRLYGAATGIERVMVNGETVVEACEFTDARPGRILRSGTDTKTLGD